jgi:hypothetical protein
MAELKTQPTRSSVAAFLGAIPDERRRKDCAAVARIMRRATGARPQMWGSSIVGFGRRHYKYASGREGDWFVTGFSPRKGDLTLYISGGFDGHETLMRKLGKYKTGKSCLYIRTLADIDVGVLTALIETSVDRTTSRAGNL